jgi:hypothetical protein
MVVFMKNQYLVVDICEVIVGEMGVPSRRPNSSRSEAGFTREDGPLRPDPQLSPHLDRMVPRPV